MCVKPNSWVNTMPDSSPATAGPVCALVNNLLERYFDGFKMVYEHRRPWPELRSGIGPW